MPIPIIGKLVKGFVGTDGIVDANNVEVNSVGLTGVLTGTIDSQTALNRLDGTGVGASIFRFTGSYSAQASNISEWFGDRQQTRLRCTDDGGVSPVVFQLPGLTALGTAFDTLSTAGLDEVIRFVIEYTGDTTTFMRVEPRSGGPVIKGTSAIIVRSGIAATVEVTRTSGTIDDYVFEAIGQIAGGDGAGNIDAIKLINPADTVWDASTNGTLPSSGVVKGNAYQVVNAPTDGSGRFDEVMLTDDWVVWDGETFTSWSATPHSWFVLPAHDVRRITALEQNFLTNVQTTPQSDRNGVTRGANYADTAGEIRMKVYVLPDTYSAADLNTTGDIDEYTDPSNQTGRLAIRLTGNQSALTNVLPTLYVYEESASGVFTRLFNMEDDFTFQGDFGGESDWLADRDIVYTGGSTLRIYFGTVVPRYNIQNFDVFESTLSTAVQAKLNSPAGSSAQVAALESKVDALFPLTPNVDKLDAFADIYGPAVVSQSVAITEGYSLIVDYRGSGTRYESAGVTYDDTGSDVVRYTGLTADLHRAFGFQVSGPPAQVDDITLTGTSGTANITVESTAYLVTFNTDLTTTASDFVTSHASALNTAGVTVTANAGVLRFTANTAGQTFTIAAPVNATGDLAGTLANITTSQTLMWLVDGSELIPYVDMSVGGHFRINEYTIAHTAGTPVRDRFTFVDRSQGTEIVSTAAGSHSTYVIPDFPAGATDTSRTAEFDVDIYVNGTDTGAGGFIDFPIPNTSEQLPLDTQTHTFSLGPLYGNRSVACTLGFAFEVVGGDYRLVMTLEDAPSDVTVSFGRLELLESYTPADTVTRTDNFVNFTDAGGDFTFSGSTELLISFHPFEVNGRMDAVPVAISLGSGQVDELNNRSTPIPDAEFSSVEIPDQTALSGFQFRTFESDHFFTHSQLSTLVRNHATQWSYGLARLDAVTEQAITGDLDFTTGIILVAPDNGRWRVTVDNTGTLQTTEIV